LFAKPSLFFFNTKSDVAANQERSPSFDAHHNCAYCILHIAQQNCTYSNSILVHIYINSDEINSLPFSTRELKILKTPSVFITQDSTPQEVTNWLKKKQFEQRLVYKFVAHSFKLLSVVAMTGITCHLNYLLFSRASHYISFQNA
jgi:hypothetical protein